MDRRFKLSNVDMMTFLVQALLGIRILNLPRTLVKVAGTDSWMSVLLGGGVVLILSLMLYWLGIRFPEKNGSQIVEEVFGKGIGKIGAVLIAMHVSGSIGFSLNIFANSLKLYLLSNTPMFVVTTTMIVLGFYALTKGLKTIAALINILLPQLIFWMGLLLLLPLKRMELQNLLPFLSNGLTPVFMGSFEVIDALYGFTIIAYLMPYFKNRKPTLKWIFPGIFISIILYMGIISVSLAVFGADEIVRLLFPTLSLAKSMELDFDLIERAESIFMVVWIINTFIMMMLSLFVGYENFKVLFPQKEKLCIYAQLPLIILFLTLARNTVQINLYTQYINYLGRFITVVLIPLSFGVVLIKERVKKYES